MKIYKNNLYKIIKFYKMIIKIQIIQIKICNKTNNSNKYKIVKFKNNRIIKFINPYK